MGKEGWLPRTLVALRQMHLLGAEAVMMGSQSLLRSLGTYVFFTEHRRRMGCTGPAVRGTSRRGGAGGPADLVPIPVRVLAEEGPQHLLHGGVRLQILHGVRA